MRRNIGIFISHENLHFSTLFANVNSIVGIAKNYAWKVFLYGIISQEGKANRFRYRASLYQHALILRIEAGFVFQVNN